MLTTSWYSGGSARQTWIDVCQRARVDPYALVSSRLGALLTLNLDATVANGKV